MVCDWPAPPTWLPPADPPLCDWAANWVTWFEFTAEAVADEVFACVAAYWSSRGIQIWINIPKAPEPAGSGAAPSIRTETFAFVGALCVEIAVALASCAVGAL